jgi:hypothetical protein
MIVFKAPRPFAKNVQEMSACSKHSRIRYYFLFDADDRSFRADDPRHFPKTASGGIVWLLFRLLFVALFIWNVMKLASLSTVLNPGDAVTFNVNQLKSETNIALDIPTLDFRIENSILFFEAEFPTIQSIEVPIFDVR